VQLLRFAVAVLVLAAASASAAGVIDAADIIGKASADVPFAQQSGYWGQVLGMYPAAAKIPESGIHGVPLPNGETLRLGKEADPAHPTRKALVFQLAPNDPSTSGSMRSEIAFGRNIEMGKVYWVAFSAFVRDWGTLGSSDQALFGTQIHSSRHELDLSPAFAFITGANSRTMLLDVYYSTSSSPSTRNTVRTKYAERPIPFDRWSDFVFKFRESTGSDGFLQVWLDGEQILNYQGPLGYYTPGYKDYAKFGYYNWGRFNSGRKVLLRAPTVVADPTGNKYDAAALRAYINQ
jgi:hypothetical protein